MNANILIVDDDILSTNQIKKSLVRMNHCVVATTESGETAISLAGQLQPDLILLNVSLNTQSGKGWISEKIEKSLMIPIVYLVQTQNETNSSIERASLSFGYLVKPVLESELNLAVKFALYATKMRKELLSAGSSLKDFFDLNRTILENILDLVFVTDDRGNFTFVCSNVKHILGYKVGEILDAGNIEQLVKHPRIRIEQLQPHLPVTNLETIIVDKNNNERSFSTTIKKITAKNGTILFTFHDIDVLKKAEKEADLHRLYFRLVFEQAPIGMAIIDSYSGELVRINQKFANIVGYPIDEMPGMNTKDIIFPDDLEKSVESLHRLLTGELKSYRIEHRYVSKRNSVKWARLTVVPLWTTKPRNPVHLALVEDITEKKQVDQRLKRTGKHLKEVNTAFEVLLKRKEEFFGEFGKEMMVKIEDETIPLLEQLKSTRLDQHQKQILKSLESNLYQLIGSPRPVPLSLLSVLSPAEIEIAKQIGSNQSTKEIARKLNLSSQTIETHRKNIRKKLALTNQRLNLKTYLSNLFQT